jgi:hypothetical protein
VFNQCWSDTSLGIIPFFISLGDKDFWLHEFAVKYYQTFASHYISFFERNENMVKELLSLDQIRQYGVDHSIQKLVDDIDMLQEYKTNNT